MKGTYEYTTCGVHKYVDKDATFKWCEWCETCEEFICNECKTNYVKRGRAALIKLKKKI